MTETRAHLPPRPAPGGNTDWRDLAACRDSDPELFFPVGNAGPALRQVARAKQICAGCTVRAPCLEWALGSGQEAGVWGGTSEDERRALRRMSHGPPGRLATTGRGPRNHLDLMMPPHPGWTHAGVQGGRCPAP